MPLKRDQASEYAAAWEAFERLERVSPHRQDWATWAAGRDPHVLLMALVDDAHAVGAVVDVQTKLRGLPGLELHASHFFHISIQSLGFGSEVFRPHLVDRLGCALRKVPSFDVVLGGVNAFHSAIFLETHSGGHLLETRRAIRGAIGEPIVQVDPHAGYLFHLTLGYMAHGCDLQQVREAIRPLRTDEVTRVRINSVALVQVPTDQREAFPRLSPLATFALAG